MPAKRLSMRKIREVLRLYATGVSNRQIAFSCQISRPTVSEYIRRSVEAGLSWPLPSEVDDAALESLLYPRSKRSGKPPAGPRALPDCNHVNRELKHKNVTLFLLWQEYRARHPDGYQYSWFCNHYRHWLGKQDLVMRQNHRAGEKLFIDYPTPNRRSGANTPID